MSVTDISPAREAPGSITIPCFRNPMVTVASLFTAIPETCPLLPFTPEGISMARTDTFELFIALIHSAVLGRT